MYGVRKRQRYLARLATPVPAADPEHCLHAPLPCLRFHLSTSADVKTDNVLCRDDGSYCLGDFGCVAKIPKNRKILADTYHKDDCCGSPDFCAPEAALANRDLRPKTPWLFLKNCIRMRTKLPLTRAVDIYSLGVLAVCLLVTGTFQESAARYAHRELPLPPHVPSALAQLVLDCTEDKSHQRPSAEQVLQRLDAMEAEVLAAEAKATAE